MTTFRTRSGSVYQVDEPNRLVRQLTRSDALDGGSRRLASGEWLDYFHVQHDGAGTYLWIWLENDGCPVVTSKLVEVVGCSISD